MKKSYNVEMCQDKQQVVSEAGQISSKSNILATPKMTQQTRLSFYVLKESLHMFSVFHAYLWQNVIQ